MSSNELPEASVLSIHTGLRELRADMKEMDAKITEMWLTVVERKAMQRVVLFVFGGVLAGLGITGVGLAIAQMLH